MDTVVDEVSPEVAVETQTPGDAQRVDPAAALAGDRVKEPDEKADGRR